MKLHMIMALGLVLAATSCAEKEQAAPETADQAPTTPPAAATNAPGTEIWQNESFREHMHLHAQNLDDLNFALADGDLDSAKVSASWLESHDTDADVQSEWLPHLYRMRAEAAVIRTAPDLATARVAAERLSMQCQECHLAVGINIE